MKKPKFYTVVGDCQEPDLIAEAVVDSAREGQTYYLTTLLKTVYVVTLKYICPD
ncbi:MAG: hypothetical protein HQ553_10905 [Chloroflexi bacterium]|nr:hypothetical protein [Chloroflexota bacterium]